MKAKRSSLEITPYREPSTGLITQICLNCMYLKMSSTFYSLSVVVQTKGDSIM